MSDTTSRSEQESALRRLGGLLVAALHAVLTSGRYAGDDRRDGFRRFTIR